MSSKNVAFEIKRDEDLPEQNERERRYLSHAELLLLAKAADRFETDAGAGLLRLTVRRGEAGSSRAGARTCLDETQC